MISGYFYSAEVLDEILAYLDLAAAALDVAPRDSEGVDAPVWNAFHELDKARHRAWWLRDSGHRQPGHDLATLLDHAALALRTATSSRFRVGLHSALHHGRQLVRQARELAGAWYDDLPEPIEREELW